MKVTAGREVGVESRLESSEIQSGDQRSEVSVVLLTNGVSWYLRSGLTVDQRQLRVTTPRTILGLIPVGKRRLAVDLLELSTVSLGTKLNPGRMIVAAALGLAAAFGGFGAIVTAACSVAAVAFLLLGFIAVVRIEERNRPASTVPVCLANLPRARRFIAEVELRSVVAHQSPGAGDD